MGGFTTDRVMRTSLVILAGLGLVAFCHFAASVLIAILSSILIVLALDPFVQFLCRRAKLGRPLASMIVVFFGIALLYLVLYLAYSGTRQLFADLPRLIEQIQKAPLVREITERIGGITSTLREAGKSIVPGGAPLAKPAATPLLQDVKPWLSALSRGIGSLTTILFSLSFIPFLVYFLLAGKEEITQKTRELFPVTQQETAGAILYDIERMMRRFILGNTLVALILGVATSLVFLLAGMPYWIVLGMLSGLLSTIPYLGLALALVPPLLVGLVAFESGGAILLVAVAVTVFHLVAANYLIPRFVGSGVQLNAVASTAAIMFFGWLWGGMGLILGIPVLAVAKCVMDNIDSTRRFGAWLGE
ncbi:MAG: hypothetical protein Kow00128_14670 [Deltaproteobacteria bacterium]